MMALLEKLFVNQLVIKNVPVLLTWRSITVVTRAHRCPLSWTVL